MTKKIEELSTKSTKELEVEIQKAIEELARISVEAKVNPSKDSNQIAKKKKYIAQLKTVAGSIKE